MNNKRKMKKKIKKKPITYTHTQKVWWNGSRCRPEFKPQYCKKKKKMLMRIREKGNVTVSVSIN
jgi:hypothetical protein